MIDLGELREGRVSEKVEWFQILNVEKLAEDVDATDWRGLISMQLNFIEEEKELMGYFIDPSLVEHRKEAKDMLIHNLYCRLMDNSILYKVIGEIFAKVASEIVVNYVIDYYLNVNKDKLEASSGSN